MLCTTSSVIPLTSQRHRSKVAPMSYNAYKDTTTIIEPGSIWLNTWQGCGGWKHPTLERVEVIAVDPPYFEYARICIQAEGRVPSMKYRADFLNTHHPEANVQACLVIEDLPS